MCTLYLMRVTSNGEVVPAVCCESCRNIINRAGIRKVINIVQ